MPVTVIRTSLESDKRFVRWTGHSGRARVFSIYDAADVPAYAHAVYVVVDVRGDSPRLLAVAATGALPALVLLGRHYRAALEGGSEVHVHIPNVGECVETVARDLECAGMTDAASPALAELAA